LVLGGRGVVVVVVVLPAGIEETILPGGARRSQC
jgi:hypothetical protein